MQVLRAPFPWFGGKSRVAHVVWDRFGNVPNYIEPFAGSLAVLLGRPHQPKTETVNDADCYLANFWRALQYQPEEVAAWADWPVNEADLHARHQWLVNQAEFRERIKTEPEYFDVRIAGWWVWGQCAWIGSGWCAQLPHLGDAKVLGSYMQALAERLRSVRICCGDWARITGPSVTFKHGITGVFLDPPYADSADREAGLYAQDSTTVAHDVRAWAMENGDNRSLRIALCGYKGEHNMPDTWECVAWKAHGGYGSQAEGSGRANAKRERIWFSPHCLRPSLFETCGGDFDLCPE